MNSIRASVTVLWLLFSIFASAKEVTDTLYTAKNDRIIVTYSIMQKGNKVELQFKSVRKLLGDYHHGKYRKDADRIHTLFFDRIGSMKKTDMQFDGETPSIICLPAKASYKKSSDGYFVVEQRPTLSFDMETSEPKTFTIPLYLAHYERKQLYKILCSCGELEVRIPYSTTQSATPPTTKETTSRQSVNEIEEIGEEFEELDDQALNLIKLINKDLYAQESLPMASTLVRKVDNLVDLQPRIKTKDVAKRIDETLEAYENKKKELEKVKTNADEQKADDDAFTNCTTKEEYERYLKQHPNGSHVEEAKAEIKTIDNKAKEEEDKKNKRTIWMVVGGALLAILLFVGNQVLQSFRNIRTQRSMMQMQQDATKRAQNMARGKVKSEIRKQTNKVTGQVKKKSQTALRDTANKVKNNKGNKRVSI